VYNYCTSKLKRVQNLWSEKYRSGNRRPKNDTKMYFALGDRQSRYERASFFSVFVVLFILVAGAFGLTEDCVSENANGKCDPGGQNETVKILSIYIIHTYIHCSVYCMNITLFLRRNLKIFFKKLKFQKVENIFQKRCLIFCQSIIILFGFHLVSHRNTNVFKVDDKVIKTYIFCAAIYFLRRC